MIGWVDASSGASGDMLLGALAGVDVPPEVIQAAVDRVSPEPVGLRVEAVTRSGLAATRVHVDLPPDVATHRTWRDVRALLQGLDAPLRDRAASVFRRLAEAEGRVHGVDPDEVGFHEVGALDAIADIVGVCAGLEHLGLERLVVSPVALGGGRVQAAHGSLPVPGPAVVELLRGSASYGGPISMELCTPTGAALLTTYADEFAAQPPMRVSRVGVGAGGRDPEGHPNVLRLLVGESLDAPSAADVPAGELAAAVVIETNVDDLDPRLWPDVLLALLAAGASDAWLTPILMKKGRPAHTLHVLASDAAAESCRRAIFEHTSTLGVREHRFAKHALDRRMAGVEIDGHRIAVKIAALDGRDVNVQPEYDDVARVAAATGRPAKDVLAQAAALAREGPATWT